MKLEDAIHQDTFRNERHKALLNIYYRNGHIFNQVQQILKGYELTPQQFNLLRIVRGQHPASATINLLKERMLDKDSDVSRLVTRLHEKELLERRTCPDNRRKMDVKLTEKGTQLLLQLDTVEQRFEDLLSPLSDEEVEKLNYLLGKIDG